MSSARTSRSRRFAQKTYSLGPEQNFRWDKALAAADAIEDEELAAFGPERPFRNLGLRSLRARPDEVELALQERSGTEGFQQILKPSSL